MVFPELRSSAMQHDDDPFDDSVIDDDDDDGNPEEELERPHGVRFGEGQPINRGGRPRGSPNLKTLTRRVAMQRHHVTIDGKRCRKSTIELMVLSLKKKAAAGDVKAFKLQQSWLQKLAPRQERRTAVLIGPEQLDAEEWEAVYGGQMSDEEVGERYPYLMRVRREHQAYTAKLDRQIEEAQASIRTNGRSGD